LLYVLNAANTDTSADNVVGFRVDANGALTSIPGSIRPLSTDHPNPAQGLLDPQRRVLLVTEKRTNVIDVYKVGRDGSLSGPNRSRTIRSHHAGWSSRATGVSRTRPRPIAKRIPAIESIQTVGIGLLNADGVTGTTPGGTFPIEETLSRDGQFLYVIDARLLLATPGPATLSGFPIQENGKLTPVVDPASITLPLSAFGLAADLYRRERPRD
jgi:hypothetical protein